MRAVIYARYSTEMQRDTSIADQVEVCRRYAERNGWTVTSVYQDAAASGATAFRPGYASMLADAESRRFDVVVCEAIDRLSRKLADLADLHDRLTFTGVAIYCSTFGLVTPMHVGMMGTFAQMTLADLRHKTWRGQLGRARAGAIPGGLAYGYAVVPPAPGAVDRGYRVIVPDEAEIIRRIYRDYAAGKSPRAIARALNEEKLAGPGGRPWGDTTIRGQPDRGTGILNNPVYCGILKWNRCSYVKNPTTGKRAARVNDASKRETVEVPQLRIIDQDLWNRVEQQRSSSRRAATTASDCSGPMNTLNGTHRKKFLLSGLLTCGLCGGGYTIIGKDRYGCATRRSKGTCQNRTSISRQVVEVRVLAGLKDRMLEPSLVAEFVRTFAAEQALIHREAIVASTRLHSDLEEVERRLAGVLQAVENGAWSNSINGRLCELEACKAKLQQDIEAGSDLPMSVQLHPNVADIYRARVADLQIQLARPEVAGEAATTLTRLIQRIVLTPDATAENGLAVDLHGDLALILSLASGGNARKGAPTTSLSHNEKLPTALANATAMGSLLTVVAGTGFEPVTFRL